MYRKLHNYITAFNKTDEECYLQLIPNSEAESFLAEQIPLIDIPDKEIEEIYYFRWWTFRKHIKETENGHIITEFLPDVPWSGPYNSINCPSCFHIREGRWLKDSGQWLKEYIDFWLDGIGDAHCYSAWYAHALLEYCTVKNDFNYAVQKLEKLIVFFETREKKQRRNGLYWSRDNLDGMEFSISGSGLRPTINSYAYADALAISKIAEIAGDTRLKERFEQKAREIKEATDRFLWDNDFYKTIPLSENDNVPFESRPLVAKANDVKELCGFVPWYFNMPDEGKDVAFSELLDKDGFMAAFGLTTAEQRHPRFLESHAHECLWNGPVWPFATSQALVATANLLHNYNQATVSKEDYYQLLLQYARSQHIEKNDGSVVPWIDENMHPFNGRWIARDILRDWGWLPDKGGYERGKDYNHSLYCDLVLSGLLGIDVKCGIPTVSPLIPNSWDYFKVENLWIGNIKYRIIYDKNGTHYGLGSGLFIQKY